MITYYLTIIEKENDKEYFDIIYDLYNEDIFYQANKYLKNIHDAEDISQEVWLIFAQNISTLHFNNEKSTKAYLMKIVKYKSIDALRKKNREITHTTELDIELVEDNQAKSDEVLLSICQKENINTILECINHLDELYRDILSFYYLKNMTAKKISKLLCINQKTVEKRISRGRETLIRMLVERGINNEKVSKV